MRREGRRRGPRREPPWAPTPGSRKIARGISSRSRARRSGRVAPGHGADRGEPAVADGAPRRARRPGARAARAAGGSARHVLERRRRPGSRCGRARSTPAPAVAAASSSGSSASRPSSGLAVKASAPRPAHRAERARRLADQRLRVGARRDRHVAALAVGDHEQAVVARARPRCSSASQPGAPSRSKQASWSLTATHAGPGRLDRERGSARRPPRPSRLRASVRLRRARRRRAASTAAGQSAAGSGSSPSTIWLRRSSTSAASRSGKAAVTLRPGARPRSAARSGSTGRLRRP